jgi:hypothetical protein
MMKAFEQVASSIRSNSEHSVDFYDHLSVLGSITKEGSACADNGPALATANGDYTDKGELWARK